MPKDEVFLWVCLLSLAPLAGWAAGQGPDAPRNGGERPVLVADGKPEPAQPDTAAGPQPPVCISEEELLANPAARAAAAAALAAAQNQPAPEPAPPAEKLKALPVEGRPGDVRLVSVTTDLPARKRHLVPPLPLPPLIQWGHWLDEHKVAAHCSLDWMDQQGRWWHTEMRGYSHHPARYLVGEGEFPGSGMTTYGIFLLPGRTDPEGAEVLLDENIGCDYRVLETEARLYGRKDRLPGDPGTGGNGSRNVGLGGPAFKPSQNSNTYINYLLRRAGVRHAAPKDAIGWDTIPHFPYSSDARE